VPIAKVVDCHLWHDQAEAHGQYDGHGRDTVGDCGADQLRRGLCRIGNLR
jgi:hypothetical protein